MREQRGQLPAWGVAWTEVKGSAQAVAPTRLRCHGCHLSVYFDGASEGQEREARAAMIRHSADCRQINVLVLRLDGDVWTVDHYGPRRAEVARAFDGETVIPTPYTSALSGADVAAHLRRRNPGAVVLVEGPDEAADRAEAALRRVRT